MVTNALMNCGNNECCCVAAFNTENNILLLSEILFQKPAILRRLFCSGPKPVNCIVQLGVRLAYKILTTLAFCFVSKCTEDCRTNGRNFIQLNVCISPSATSKSTAKILKMLLLF